MSHANVSCEQAIFTSVRTPMGEGYRIIAASAGLKSEEKQAITRLSPSHDGLCPMDDARNESGPAGVAMYALPTGRLCIALSWYAGAEHTGRGGQRTYTHNLVLEAKDLAAIAFNPFHIRRAMSEAGLLQVQLKPPPVLETLRLEVENRAAGGGGGAVREQIHSQCRRSALEKLLRGQRVVVETERDSIECAEALLLGVPGPMRGKISFSAGLRYSATRTHHLQLLTDQSTTTRNRVAGQCLEYLRGSAPYHGDVPVSAWLDFVSRHWETADLSGLARRTSRPYSDVSAEARERIGRIFNTIDEAAQTPTESLLHVCSAHLDPVEDSVMRDLRGELLDAVRKELSDRFAGKPWVEVVPTWPKLVLIMRRGEAGAAFAVPLARMLLHKGVSSDPIDTARLALLLAADPIPNGQALGTEALLDEVLALVSRWAQNATTHDLARLEPLIEQWRLVRPAAFANIHQESHPST